MANIGSITLGGGMITPKNPNVGNRAPAAKSPKDTNPKRDDIGERGKGKPSAKHTESLRNDLGERGKGSTAPQTTVSEDDNVGERGKGQASSKSTTPDDDDVGDRGAGKSSAKDTVPEDSDLGERAKAPVTKASAEVKDDNVGDRGKGKASVKDTTPEDSDLGERTKAPVTKEAKAEVEQTEEIAGGHKAAPKKSAGKKSAGKKSSGKSKLGSKKNGNSHAEDLETDLEDLANEFGSYFIKYLRTLRAVSTREYSDSDENVDPYFTEELLLEAMGRDLRKHQSGIQGIADKHLKILIASRKKMGLAVASVEVETAANIEALTAAEFKAAIKKGARVVLNAGTPKDPEYYLGSVTGLANGGKNARVLFDDGDDAVYVINRSKTGLIGLAKGTAKRKSAIPASSINKFLKTPLGQGDRKTGSPKEKVEKKPSTPKVGAKGTQVPKNADARRMYDTMMPPQAQLAIYKMLSTVVDFAAKSLSTVDKFDFKRVSVYYSEKSIAYTQDNFEVGMYLPSNVKNTNTAGLKKYVTFDVKFPNGNSVSGSPAKILKEIKEAMKGSSAPNLPITERDFDYLSDVHDALMQSPVINSRVSVPIDELDVTSMGGGRYEYSDSHKTAGKKLSYSITVDTNSEEPKFSVIVKSILSKRDLIKTALLPVADIINELKNGKVEEEDTSPAPRRKMAGRKKNGRSWRESDRRDGPSKGRR